MSRRGAQVADVQLSEMPVARLDGEGAITRNTDEAYSVIIPSTRTLICKRSLAEYPLIVKSYRVLINSLPINALIDHLLQDQRSIVDGNN